MAIKINITANVSNIPQIRKKIQSQLQNINIGLGSGTTKTGTGVGTAATTTGIKARTQEITNLINRNKALILSEEDFIKIAKQEILTLKESDGLLAARARLTQA
jgi:hypothetical protein